MLKFSILYINGLKFIDTVGIEHDLCSKSNTCLSFPPWKLFGVLLNVWSSFSTDKLPLDGLGYLFAHTAILEILGAVNIFVTFIEKKIKKFLLLLFNSWIHDSVETSCSGHFRICKLAWTLNWSASNSSLSFRRSPKSWRQCDCIDRYDNLS